MPHLNCHILNKVGVIIIHSILKIHRLVNFFSVQAYEDTFELIFVAISIQSRKSKFFAAFVFLLHVTKWNSISAGVKERKAGTTNGITEH